jgi:hypothetical protein
LLITQESAKEAITKSEVATQRHFDSVNEFGARMKEVVTNQASKEWAEGFEKEISRRMGKIEDYITANMGRDMGLDKSESRLWKVISAIVVVLGVIFAILTYVNKI